MWRLTANGGEARPVATLAAGIDGVSVAADTEWRDARQQAGVGAVLHENCPARHWDHDLGSAVPHAYWIRGA